MVRKTKEKAVQKTVTETVEYRVCDCCGREVDDECLTLARDVNMQVATGRNGLPSSTKFAYVETGKIGTVGGRVSGTSVYGAMFTDDVVDICDDCEEVLFDDEQTVPDRYL